MKKVNEAMERVRELIDELCDPGEMDRDEYKSFCERIQSEAEGRLDALCEEDCE